MLSQGCGRQSVVVRKDQKQIDPDLLRKLYQDCDGFEFLCHEIRHPNRKAGEERSFWTVETNFLPGRRFSSLEDLNQQDLTQLSCHLPAPYCLEERSTDQYGFMAYNGKATGHKTGSPDSECCRVTADQVPPISGHVPPVSISSESPRDSAAQTTCWTAGPSTPLCLPVPDPRRLNQVHRYLTGARRLPERLLEPLIASGRLYADQRGNAVFLLEAETANTPVGAELRGTSSGVWRGMARGTRKDEGYFRTGLRESRTVILCESAIDAISCETLQPGCLCISTSGARPNPRWLRALLDRGHTVHCGFDTDAAGESAAASMIALHPAIHRLRPPAHDWNDALTADIHT